MKISKVKIKNFRGYGENPQNQDGFYLFEELDKYKLIILNGFNGYGKTSFFDAIEWCLSGEIRRIKKIFKDSTYESISKKSWHLKFNKWDGAERETAIVEMEFDNGYILCRTSNSVSLEDYSDKFCFKKDITTEYKDEVAKKELIKELTSRNLDLAKIYKSIALGQETLATFLRGQSPANRDEELMNLLNLEDLNLLKSKSDANNFSKLNNLKYDAELKEIIALKKSINSIFKSSGFEIEDYIDKVNAEYQQLLGKYGEFIKYKMDSNKISSVIQFINYLVSQKDEIVKNISILKERNVNIKKYIRLSRYIEIDSKNIIVQKLALTDIGSLQKKKICFENRYNKHTLYLEKFIKYKQDLFKEKYEIEKNLQNIQSVNKIYVTISEIDNMFSELYKWQIIHSKEANNINVRNETLIEGIKIVDKNIDIKQAEITQLSGINNEYKYVLDDVKSFIEKNDIESCPVCKSKNICTHNDDTFIKDETVKDKLLKVINQTISNGESNLTGKINQLDKIRNTKEELVRIYKKCVIDIYCKYNNIIMEYINAKIDKLERVTDEVRTSKSNIYDKKVVISNLISNFQNSYKYVFNKEYEQDSKGDLNNVKVELEDKKRLIHNIIMKNYPDIELEIIKNEIEAIEIKFELKKSDIIELIDMIKLNIEKVRIEMVILEDINRILKKYTISDTNLEELRGYENIKDKETSYTNISQLIQTFKDDRAKINEMFKDRSESLLDTRLQAYKGLGNFIYGKISPHPFYREFDFNKMHRGLEVTTKTNKNINLSHIFSNAQVNILALSIFLGLGLSENKIMINQLFIDDPIQSMDDINVLAFIDLLRTILLSKKINKQLIVSTHDENFCDLLKIKLRNISYKEIKFAYYGEEGPIIEERVNQVSNE